MSLTKFTENTNVISELPDTPSLTATELKAKFDEVGGKVKTYLNNTLTTETEQLVATEKASLQSSISNLSTQIYSALSTLESTMQSNVNALQSKINGTVLYENSTGTTGAVTLSDSIADGDRIRISGYTSDTNHTVYFSQDLNVVLNEDMGLLFKGFRGGLYDYIMEENIQLTSTGITRGVQHRTGFLAQTGEQTGMNVDDTLIYITKVVKFDY